MTECIIKKIWGDTRMFEFSPSDLSRYTHFTLYSNCHPSYYPSTYINLNPHDVILVFEEYYLRFPKKYLQSLKEFLEKYGNINLKSENLTLNKKSIKYLLMRANIKNFMVSWGSSRTILNALDREALAYALSFSGLIIIFRKRGGYLAYYIVVDSFTLRTNGRACQIEPFTALKSIKGVEIERLGETYIKEGLEEEMTEKYILKGI